MIKDDELGVKKSISLPRTILERAMQRARRQRRSFSNYLQLLIARDVEHGRKDEERHQEVTPEK